MTWTHTITESRPGPHRCEAVVTMDQQYGLLAELTKLKEEEGERARTPKSITWQNLEHGLVSAKVAWGTWSQRSGQEAMTTFVFTDLGVPVRWHAGELT